MTQKTVREQKLKVRKAELQYVDDSSAGLRRMGRAGRFRYRNGKGFATSKAVLDRIRKLAIPPAWTDVWIAGSPHAHLQATGRDAKERKQYRYHPDFVAMRDLAKYEHLTEFAAALPLLRKQVKQDLHQPALTRGKVVAAIITLLQETMIRIGNESYAQSNDSFGLTTLRNRHVKIRGPELRFMFKGKSGKQWALAITDKRVARVVRSCQDLPGQHLFEYRDEGGDCHVISSADVNAYLKDATGRDITAKDFRTWAGTVLAATQFHENDAAPTKTLTKAIISTVAAKLGNTVSICRRCYIHPRIIAAFEAGKLRLRVPAKGRNGLAPAEIAVLNFLRRAGA